MNSLANQMHSRKRNHSQMDEETVDGSAANLDIVQCFPRLVCQHVFQHLNVSELLELSTVSKNWNEFVGDRPQVGKLKLVIDQKERKLTRKAKSILKNSDRKYQNIKISVFPNDAKWLLEFFADRAGFWKSVELETCGPFTQVWPKLLNILNPSIETLAIHDCYRSKASPTVATSWTFPRLKRLQCDSNHHEVFRHFVRVSSLVKFHWSQPIQATETTKPDIHAILHNNQKLEYVRANTNWTFFDQLPETRFKLQKLSVVIRNERDSTASFFSFLKSQAQTLETLDIDLETDQPILDLIFRMPRLTSLKTGILLDGALNLPLNSTITTYEVEGQLRLDAIMLITFLRGLKHFKCSELTELNFFFLVRQAPALETIETKHPLANHNYFRIN